MMNALDTFKEEMAFSLFGRSRTLAIAGNQCVKCGGSVVLSKDGGLDFRDEVSEREYGISGFCQSCQDNVFGLNDEDKEETLSAAKDAIPGFFVPPEALDGLER
jgi:hypothetical protein